LELTTSTEREAMSPTFTSDWAGQIRSIWPVHVIPNVDRRGPVNWLEIGSFEGRSALWTVENLLPCRDSRIYCVDRWQVWEKFGGGADLDYEDNFDANTRGLEQVVKLKGESRDLLPLMSKGFFHGAYIDGSHEYADVLLDARLVTELVRPGAVLVFDDYELPSGDGVKRAVDQLLVEWRDRVDVIHVGYQVVVRMRG
jgi:predicted O-methyltransferase YrrM